VRDLNSLIGKEIRRNRYAGVFDLASLAELGPLAVRTAAAFHFTIFSTYVLNEIESAVSLSTYRRRGVIRWAAQQARGSLPLMTG
jgi:hypothetical protein